MSAVVERKAQPIAAPMEGGATSLLQAITRAASDPSMNMDNVERLWKMHEAMVAREAEQAFNDELAACQGEIGRIAADATNPQTRSRYATYAALDKVLRPIYTRHGFSISYTTDDSPKEEHIRVLAYVSRGGHTRTYRVDMPADGKGAKGGDVMTKTHAAGAAMSYGMRYLLKAIFNVAVGEEDNDGNGSPKLLVAEFEAFKKAIEATLTKENAKKEYHKGVKRCQEIDDIESAERLKEVLLAHSSFIDSAK